MNTKEAIQIVNPEILKKLEGCGKNIQGNYGCNSNNRECGNRRLCSNCKEFLKGALSQIETEIEFLDSFDWSISLDACKDALNQGVRICAGGEHFKLIIENQNNNLIRIEQRLEALEISRTELRRIL